MYIYISPYCCTKVTFPTYVYGWYVLNIALHKFSRILKPEKAYELSRLIGKMKREKAEIQRDYQST